MVIARLEWLVNSLAVNKIKDRFVNVAAWAFASAVAIAFALVQSDSVINGESYIPFGNDAFYHARRILDAAFAGGLYQFDPLIHMTDGSWIPWPWGFDWALANILKVSSWLSPNTDPMKLLVYAPVVWIAVNVALLIAMCSALGLRPEFRALVAIGFALLPTTQMLHGIGQIDHHFVEFTFVLLCVLTSMKMLAGDSGNRAAIVCGATLGIAQAFHHGLFVLQIPLLASIFVIWWRGGAPTSLVLRNFSIALLASTLLIAIPSEPFRDIQFSFATLSWFHVYIALASSILVFLMTLRSPDRKSLWVLSGVGVLLAVPAIGGIATGARFLTGDIPELAMINEMTSPPGMIFGGWGLTGTVWIYSWLLLLAIPLLLFSLWRAVTVCRGPEVVYALYAAFGLTLLLMQLRLNYFGMAFLLITPFVIAEQFLAGREIGRLATALSATAILAIALQPPLSGGLFRTYPAGGEVHYHNLRPLLGSLQAACAENPGIVLADRNLGHYIRFHTECGVIANNFLLTELHFTKVRVVDLLFAESPESLLEKSIAYRYVLTFLDNAYEQRGGMTMMRDLEGLVNDQPALTRVLLANPPPGITVLNEIELETESGKPVVFAGLYQLRD